VLAPSLLSMLCQLGVAIAPTLAQSRPPIVSTLDAQVGAAPALVRIAGRQHLVYELHLTNLTRADVTLARVAVQDNSRGIDLTDFRDAALARRIGRPGASPDYPTRESSAPDFGGRLYLASDRQRGPGSCPRAPPR
jgi:hypothetical protein